MPGQLDPCGEKWPPILILVHLDDSTSGPGLSRKFWFLLGELRGPWVVCTSVLSCLRTHNPKSKVPKAV